MSTIISLTFDLLTFLDLDAWFCAEVVYAQPLTAATKGVTKVSSSILPRKKYIPVKTDPLKFMLVTNVYSPWKTTPY